MKKLFLIWLFSGSLDSMCQTLPEPSKSETALEVKTDAGFLYNPQKEHMQRYMSFQPDTLRATLLVTYDRGQQSHTRNRDTW